MVTLVQDLVGALSPTLENLTGNAIEDTTKALFDANIFDPMPVFDTEQQFEVQTGRTPAVELVDAMAGANADLGLAESVNGAPSDQEGVTLVGAFSGKLTISDTLSS